MTFRPGRHGALSAGGFHLTVHSNLFQAIVSLLYLAGSRPRYFKYASTTPIS